MPRHNQPARHRAAVAPERPLAGGSGTGSGEHSEQWRGRQYRVRSLSGARSAGSYRCPGCNQLLAVGVAHVVAWSAEDAEASDRRHWHSSCWAARNRRGPGVERSRNAPRHG